MSANPQLQPIAPSARPTLCRRCKLREAGFLVVNALPSRSNPGRKIVVGRFCRPCADTVLRAIAEGKRSDKTR
jgi:hypothetical protein